MLYSPQKIAFSKYFLLTVHENFSTYLGYSEGASPTAFVNNMSLKKY